MARRSACNSITWRVCLALRLRLGIRPSVLMFIIRHHLSRNSKTVSAFHQSKQKIRFDTLVTSAKAAITLSITMQYRIMLIQKVSGTSLKARAINVKFQSLHAGQMNFTIRMLFTKRHKNETNSFVSKYLQYIFSCGLCYFMNLWYIGYGLIRYRIFFTILPIFFLLSYSHQGKAGFSLCRCLSRIQLRVLAHSAQLSTTMNILSVKYILQVLTIYMPLHKKVTKVTTINPT